jgi:hypothetical protein
MAETCSLLSTEYHLYKKTFICCVQRRNKHSSIVHCEQYTTGMSHLKKVTFTLRCWYLLKDKLRASSIRNTVLTAYNIDLSSCPIMDLHANSISLHTAASGNVAARTHARARTHTHTHTHRKKERVIN